MGRLHTRRQRVLLIFGRLTPRQWYYREPDEYSDHAHPDCGHFASWAHASQCYLSKPHRGLSLLFIFAYTFYIRHPKRGDWVKQSIPFSYITFAAKSLDGSAHAVQVYTDVSGGT